MVSNTVNDRKCKLKVSIDFGSNKMAESNEDYFQSFAFNPKGDVDFS